MIDTGDLRRGLIVEMDGELLRVTDFQHVKQGRGSAFVRLTLKNLRSGSTTTQTFQAGTKFTPVRLERIRAQYLYADEFHHFMDVDTYDQFQLDAETLGSTMNYLTPQMVIELLTHEGDAIDIELPTAVELEVTQTDPGFRGDTATGGSKPAILETGLSVSVPLFISEGDHIKVDTRTGAYLERVST
jgi:elongation factor P